MQENNRVLHSTCRDEDIFPLVARDYTAPQTVAYWILANIETAPDAKLREAFECALRMRKWPRRKQAD